MQELLGTYEGGWDWDSFSNVPSDKVNDVTRVLNAVNSPNNYTIEAIGINVGPTALGYLSDVEDGISGAAGGGSATNATSAEQLANALSVLGGSTEMAAAGNDVVNGGGGNDIIFGDVINTDQLKVLYPSIPANLQQAGSGWAVIAWLEANVPAWGGRAGTIAYIAANHAALAAEGGRTGGNDTIDGGDGNDIIYGQEGNDTIDGGIGNDTITGGTGTDRMYGGAGSDTFRLANGEFASSELIDGGADNDTILLTNATTVDFTTGTITAVENLTGSTGDDKVTLTAALLDSFTTVNLGGGDDTLTISGNVNSSNDSQLQGVENIVLQSAATLNLSNQTEGFKINGSSGVDMITGGAGADTITGGAGADSLNGGAGEDIFQLANGDFAAGESINGGADNDTIVLTNATTVNFTTGTLTSIENLTGSAGSDTVTLSGTQLSSITTVDLGGGTDTLNVNGSVTSTADAQLQGIENVAMTGGAATLNLSAQTEAINITGSTAADVIYAAAGGGTITPGNGADTVVIQAGTTAANWTIELASDSAADTIVFKHGGAGSGHNTVVTVNGFVTSTSGNSNDRIAIEVGGSSVTSGSNFYMTKSNNSTNEAVGSSVKVIELAHNNFTTSSLTDDTNSASGPRQEIADAIGSIGAGTYTVIIYSGNGASANAGIYTLTVPNATTGMNGLTNAISGANSFTLEHVMTLNGVGFGNLSSSHFVATPSAIDPLLLDLDNNGYAFSTLGEGAAFDLDADGKKDQLAWNSSGDGILAYDVNGNGTIDNGSELFTPWFNGGNFANGSAALASLDSNGDGVIDANDEAFGKLQIWQDTNGDGVSDAGELKSLADHGITSLSASTTATNGSIDGQAIVGEGTFTRADGTTGGYVEVELDIASGGGEAPVQDETIIGTDDDDFLTGTDGDDIIIGGLGNDTLTGGAGADTFVFSEAGPDNVDTITDFVADEDAIDLGALLDAALIDENNIGDYVRIQDNGSDGMLQVDTTGTGANWVDVANLTGHGVSGTVIDIKLDDETHHIPTI
jgi:Ca2+-binding RTX toxin-like protein